MPINPLLSIHYDGKIVYDEECSIVFKSGQPIITYITLKVNILTVLKNLILHSVGQQHTKRVKKIYYRYPPKVNDNLFYKRYRLRDDEDVCLIRSWHNRWTNVHLLELFVFLIELGGRGSSVDTVDDSPLSGAVRQNIRRTMVDLNMPPEGSQEGSNVELGNADMMEDNVESHEGSAIRDPMMDLYKVNPDDEDDADDESTEIFDDGDKEEEMNYYGDTQIALTQPAISQPYDRSDHFSRLNLNAMTSDWSFIYGAPEEDPSNEFEVGQQFENKEEVMLAFKRYNIRRVVEYKVLESDQLRLDSKVIVQHIFTMVKADPTISIKVLQEGVKNHFGYKASYIKMYLLGTWVQLVTQPWPGSADTVMFH
ncbi:uncharacterized protein LOC107635959 [Arachis ipaensis]|uniref:uncharacterized protein LOC107635959 n=1 Tax=Arachis ipaensis TaxID=130454 RepID=UPI0007AF39B7|nr:uncharacterized protein LOC107635959 [Arachis ipaensis]